MISDILIRMGVERQTAKINWMSSVAMVVIAGTFYRLRNSMKTISKWTVKDLRARAGQLYQRKHELQTILPHATKTDPGYW